MYIERIVWYNIAKVIRSKLMRYIIWIGVFLGAIYKTTGIRGVLDFVKMVGTNIWELLESLNLAIIPFNNGVGLLPLVLIVPLTAAIIKWLLDGKKYGKVSDAIIEKTLGEAVEAIITPVLNWINKIIFK